MAKSVLGMFKYREDAEGAVKQLQSIGYEPKEISLIMKDTQVSETPVGTKGGQVAGSAAAGAATGAVLGGLAGLLIGVGAFVIPGLGSLLVAGPIATALGLTGAAAATTTGAVGGALTGGLLGGLIRMGLPRDQAVIYEQLIRGGGILLAVPALNERVGEVQDVLTRYRATEVRQIELPSTEVDYRRR